MAVSLLSRMQLDEHGFRNGQRRETRVTTIITVNHTAAMYLNRPAGLILFPVFRRGECKSLNPTDAAPPRSTAAWISGVARMRRSKEAKFLFLLLSCFTCLAPLPDK